MEGLMILDCSEYTDNILDMIKVFQRIGWDIYNPQGKIEYLPVGDNDDYDWQCEKISETELVRIITEKIANKEQIGVNLYYSSGEGISLLAWNTKQIMLSLVINRKVIDGGYTDMVWYLTNIIYKLREFGVQLRSYEIEEYED